MAGFNQAIDESYARPCAHCGGYHALPLPSFEDMELPEQYDGLLQRLHAGIVKAGQIDKVTALDTARHLMEGVNEGYGSELAAIEYGTPDWNMLANLEKNVYHFSAAKNYHMLKELTLALKDGDRIRSYNDFKKQAIATLDRYVGNWLRTEYDTAVAGGQMAARWVEFSGNAEIMPWLQYDTAGDSRVRPAHQALDGVIKRIDDSFWDSYYPPNGWNCRCAVNQLTGTHHATPDKDFEKPEVPKMFRVNLAKQGLAFPEDSAYFKGVPRDLLEGFVDPAKTALPNYVYDKAVMKDAEIDFDNSINYAKEDIFSLAGGIPTEDITWLKISAKDRGNEIFCKMNSDAFEVWRHINTKSKTIYNAFMKAKRSGEGYGTSLFVNQVKEARRLGFEKITVHAYGGEDIGGDWGGYYRWARLGYTMEAGDAKKFKEWAGQHNRTEKTVNELVATPEGFSYWKDYGFDWHGEFLLKDRSKNMQLLKKYLKAKGIDFKL